MRENMYGLKKRASTFPQVVFSLVLLLSLVLNTGCTTPVPPTDKAIRPVRVIRAFPEEQQRTMVLTGEVMPGETKHISFLVSGRIDDLFVKQEDDINPNTLLGKINDLDHQRALQGAQANLQAAQANLDKALAGAVREELIEMKFQLQKAREAYDFADRQLSRLRSLYESGGVSLSELERTEMETAAAEAAYGQAEAQYQRMVNGTRPEDITVLTGIRNAARAEANHYETQVARTSLYAPGTGTVAKLFYQQGEIYREGTPFMTLNSHHRIVRMSLSRQQLAHINTGDRVKVLLNDVSTEGVVATISSSPDPFTRTYRVEVELGQASLMPGDLVQVELSTKGVLGTLLPMKAVLAGNPDYVYVIDNETAIQVPVKLQQLDGLMVWVSGLRKGQQVVIEGMHLLSQGETVRVVEEGEVP